MNLRETARLAFTKILNEQYDFDWQRNGSLIQSSRTQAKKTSPNNQGMQGKAHLAKRKSKGEQSTCDMLQ